MALAIGSSLITMSSTTGVFSLMNLFQMFLLLPMLTDSFPPMLTGFIVGMDFTSLSLDFIPKESIPYRKEFEDSVSYPQEDEYYKLIGLNSGSSIVNHLSLL